LRFGLGVLRLGPRDFWTMTPRELFAASEGVFGRGARAPSRDALESLMRQFPDTSEP
jgi:uncharacterized phage protein (TIGR02216 family)